MKKAAIISGIATATILLVLGLRRNRGSVVLEEKIHELQDKFKSLDAA
jgi:hypothetical protein